PHRRRHQKKLIQVPTTHIHRHTPSSRQPTPTPRKDTIHATASALHAPPPRLSPSWLGLHHHRQTSSLDPATVDRPDQNTSPKPSNISTMKEQDRSGQELEEELGEEGTAPPERRGPG
ncbi:MAG: hypothetical protein M3Y42_07255, partial [Actinomycetota bacterium]|nr:hypothetical protein [Actinomycetota bacterium]